MAKKDFVEVSVLADSRSLGNGTGRSYEDLKKKIAQEKEDAWENLKTQVSQKRYQEDIKKVDSSYITNFFKDSDKFLSQSQTESGQMTWKSANDAFARENRYATVSDLEYRANLISYYLDSNKDSIAQEQYDALSSALGEYKTSFVKASDYFKKATQFYGQFSSADAYDEWKEQHFRSSEETREDRQKQYEDNQKRIEELKAERQRVASAQSSNMTYSFGDTSMGFFIPAVDPTYQERLKSIDAQIAELEADMQQYERGEGGYTSKTVDDYYDITKQSDFGVVSANRNYTNPSRWDLRDYDLMTDSSQWYSTGNYGDQTYYDALGNEIDITNTDAKGNVIHPATQDSKYVVTDRLGMFLSATEADLLEAVASEGTWASILRAGLDGSWDQLKQNEISIYYYLLNTSGQETADKYLSDMKTELNRRMTMAQNQHISDTWDEASFLEKLALNLATVPSNVFGGVAGFIEDTVASIQGEDINPYSEAHSGMHFTNTVRGETAADFDKTGFVIPVIDFSLGDIYQVGMSRLDSALATGIGGGMGTILLGMGAAENEAYRLYQSGASAEQITWGALTAGAAEAVFEYVSFDKLIKMKDAKTVGQWVKNALIQGGIEASEEGFTDIANTITNAIIMGSESDWEKLIEENGGDTWKAFLGKVQETVQSAFGGFLGGMGAGVTSAGKTYVQTQNRFGRDGKSIIGADGGVDALKQLANEMAGVSGVDQKNLTKQLGKVDKKATAKRVGRLYDTVVTAGNAQNQADIAKSLEENGISHKNAAAIAEALVAETSGQQLTAEQHSLLKSAKSDSRVQSVIENIVENSQSTMGQRNQAIGNFEFSIALDMLAKEAAKAQTQQGQDITSSESVTTVAENASQVHHEVSEDGKMVNTKTGDVIEPQGLVQTKDGSYMIAAKDADPVSSSEVSYADSNQALVYETFVNLEAHSGKTSRVIADMDLTSRNELLGLYNPQINKDGGRFVNGILDSYFYGHRGTDLSAVSKDSPVWDLTEQQRKIAWNTGRVAGVKANTKAQSHVDTVYAEAKKILESGKAKNGNHRATLADGIVMEDMSEAQKATYQLADQVAQAVQTKIRVYKGKNKAQGFYNHATDEIWLNLNAANRGREAIMAFTLAHELVHRAKKGSPAKYQAFVDFLMKEYGKQGSDVEAMIAEQIQAAEEFNKTVPKAQRVNMTREKALEEVVSDACQRMLLDTNAGLKLAEFGAQSKENKSFLEDLKKWISEIMEKLRNFFKNVEPDSLAAKEFNKFDANVKQILADMYVDMSIDAGEKLSTIKAAYGGAFADKFLGLKDIQYNLAAEKTHREKLQKEYSEDSSTDLKTIMARYDKIIDIWTRLGGELNSKFLAEWNSKVGKDRTFTIFKAQAGYKYNVELSSMCKKGVPLFEAIDTIVKQEVMKELGTDILGKAEKEILYDILKQHHFEIPCAICYVEQARQREGFIIDAFLNGKVEKNAKGEITKVKLGWNEVLDSIQKEMKANGVNYSFAQVSRDIATEKYTPANLVMDMKAQAAFYAALKKIANQEIARYNKAEGKSRKLLNEVTPEAVKECFKGTLPANLKIFKVLFEEPSSRFKIQNDLLYSSVATQNLSMAHNKLYGLFNSQGGVSGYKTKQGTTIYWGDILGKSWKPDTLRNEGGVRNQSNSDFQMYTLLDQAQMYIDFTAKGYYLQAYTKVLSELKLFGLSRGKINASLIPKVVVYRNADGSVDIEKTMATAGLDENGNPIYDDIEGINHNEAFMLIEDPEYSKSICGICIGYSDAHINKLLDDQRVQQIIGFHDKTDDGSKRYKGARYAKNYNGLNEAVNKEGKTVHIGFNPYVKRAEKKFQFNAETETFEGTVNYNGKTYTADDIPRLATALYLEMCAKKEYTPAYKDFSGHRNYYKLLADFGLYDSQGHYAPHRKVVYNMPDTVPYLDANGKKQTMSTYDYIKAELEKELAVRDSISEALADTSDEGIIPQFKAAVKKSQEEKSFSLPKGDPAPTFYSQMARVVDGVKQEKLGASSVVSMLRGKGVKAEEIKWSGIEAWLDGKKSVTKAELQEFVAGSMLQIEEETLDNKDRPYTDDQQKRLDEYEAKRDEVANRLADEWKKITGEEFPINNAGAGLESSVVNKIIDANREHKDASFEGRLLKKLRTDLEKVITNNDDFGFDSWKDALRSIHRHRRDFITHYEMSANDKAVIVKYCNALNAYNELPNRITDADTDRLREIARETDPWNRKIMEVKHEYNEAAAKYMTNWGQYKLAGGKNYREMLFRIPGSNYSNEAMFTHWKDRKGVLAHARVQDMDTFIGKMLFIEEVQSDWHNEGHKSGYRDPSMEDKHTLSQKMEKYTEDFFSSPTADMVKERIAPIGYEGAGVSMILNFLLDSQESMQSTLNTLSRKGAEFTESEVNEIAKHAREYEEMYHAWENAPGDLTAPDAPFKDTYHEYVLKRLLRMAAEEGYDSIGWTPADVQMERWNPRRKTNAEMGLKDAKNPDAVAFEEGYRIEYDQDIPKFLSKYGKKWDTKVGKTVLDNGTEVWSMAITDSMKDSVLYDGQVVYSLPKVEAIKPSEEQVAKNIREVAGMKPVHSVDASKLDKTGKKPSEIFTEYFDSWGWNIHSDELGDIEITRRSVKDEVRHGITAEKIASIEAIPSVIQQGKIIFTGLKPDTTVYRIVICAPITIGKNSYYMGVMLQRDANTQRLYIHNVVIEEETPTFSPAGLLTTGANENNERLFITNILQAALNVKHQIKLDKEYMDAVKRGDMETAQRLVDQKAAEVGAKLIYDPDPDGFYVLKNNIPTNWVEAYKVFNMYDGEIYPLYIKNANKTPIPFRTWVGGKEGGRKYEALNGHAYVLGDTGQTHPRSAFSDEVWQQMVDDGVVKPNAKNSPKMLAYRPGWHGTSRPFFPQGGKKDDSSNYGKIHTANHVVCKVRFSKDVDLTQTAVDNAPLTKDGRPNMNEADLKYLPQVNGKHGSYEYRTNRGIPPEVAKKSKWYVASAMYVESVLTQEEADSLLTKSGIPIQEWEGGSLDLTALGYTQDIVNANPKLRDAVTYDDDGNVIPLSERFNLDKNDVRYKLPVGEDTSPRALLANAFEGIITNDIEKQKIQEYKGKVEMLNAEEKKLNELRAQIKELSFAKGKRDTKKIQELQFDAVHTANRIATLDKVLLRLEAATPLQNILKREKEMAYKRAEQKGKEALKAYREAERKRDEEWHREVKDKYQASKKKAIETRDKREAREKLQKLVLDTVKWISYPTKTDVKCPDILKQPYADFLKSIDMSSQRLANGGDPTQNDLRLTNAMGSLATALERVMVSQDPSQDATAVLDTGYLDLPANFVQKLRDMTEDVKAMMVDGDYVVNNMSAAEVRQLSQMIRTLNHAIKEVSTLYANLRFANVEALGDNTMSFMDDLGEIEKTGGMKDFVQWDNALPYYAFKRFGVGGESIFEGLMDAQDKLAFLAQNIFDFQKKAWTGKEAKAWSEDTHQIDLPNGNTLTLTTADAMSIYCLSRRQQGLQHLLGGGTRVIGLQKGSQKAKDSRSVLTIKDIDAIISSLTDRQKQVADAIQEFMSTVCSDWGNEISMKRFLTKEFTEKFYFPIESNDENLATKDPSAQQSDLFRLLNISATKPIDPRANNEVIIRNIFDVFTNHASDMARLNAYGMPLLDYMKWLNYREKTVNEEGQIKVRGVRKSMESAYGAAAKSYVLNLVKDVNGRPSDGGDPNILMKWMRAAKTASVGNSLRVATLQITSYPRAALVLSPKSLTLGLSKLPQIEKAKKYCGIALWKSFGFYDTNISRSIEDQMKGITDVKQKLIELSLKGAELGDAITWGCLWNACEYEVAATKKYKVGTEEFYEAVGKKLREVVYRTQVVDSTLTRSQIMRSKRGMAQEAAAFMSEPTLSANILMDAGFQFNAEKRRTGSVKAAWKKTGKYITRAVAVYSIGQLAAALMEGLWDAWRDDDDEEFSEKYLNAFIENLALDLVPFNKIPIVSDVFEAVLAMFDVGFYSSDKMSTTWLTQAVSAVEAWKEVLNGQSSMTAYNAIYKTMRAISSFSGVSFSGVMREGVALWNNTAGATDITWKIRTWDLSKTDLAGEALDAIIEGNDRQASSIRAEFPDEDSYRSAMRTAIKERYTAGEISYDTAIQYLIKYGGMEEDDAYWKAEEWKYENDTNDDFSKYDEFFTAVQTGKNLKAVIKKYTDNGVKVETLATQITNHFKPLYIEMSKSEKAGIKGYLLNAFELCGVKREDATKKLQYWEFLTEQPDSDLNQYQIADYYEFAKPAGISAALYSEYCSKVKGIEGDDKKKRRMAVIHSLPLTKAQKDALYFAEGWAKSTLNEAPWH